MFGCVVRFWLSLGCWCAPKWIASGSPRRNEGASVGSVSRLRHSPVRCKTADVDVAAPEGPPETGQSRLLRTMWSRRSPTSHQRRFLCVPHRGGVRRGRNSGGRDQIVFSRRDRDPVSDDRQSFSSQMPTKYRSIESRSCGLPAPRGGKTPEDRDPVRTGSGARGSIEAWRSAIRDPIPWDPRHLAGSLRVRWGDVAVADGTHL